jgi:hypothetical protein
LRASTDSWTISPFGSTPTFATQLRKSLPEQILRHREHPPAFLIAVDPRDGQGENPPPVTGAARSPLR